MGENLVINSQIMCKNIKEYQNIVDSTKDIHNLVIGEVTSWFRVLCLV